MCTTGAIVMNDSSGNKRVFGFKTSDSPWTGFWHGQVNLSDGIDTLAYGLIPQQGINAGMNRRGLALISSYFGFEEQGPCIRERPQDRLNNPYWGGDLRGIVQAEALGKCTGASEAAALMAEAFDGTAAPVGGNHVIADASGNICVFEHCKGRTGLQDATMLGYAARSNQSFMLFKEEQDRLPEVTRQDRALRLEQSERELALLKREEAGLGEAGIVERLKALTARHLGRGDQPGSICAHGLTEGRSNSSDPHHTMSALVWSLHSGVMHYTLGHPCHSEWNELRFTQ